METTEIIFLLVSFALFASYFVVMYFVDPKLFKKKIEIETEKQQLNDRKT